MSGTDRIGISISRRLLKAFDSIIKHKVMYGSKWPLLDLKQSVEEVRALPLKEDVKELWLWGNARRLLGL